MKKNRTETKGIILSRFYYFWYILCRHIYGGPWVSIKKYILFENKTQK